MLTKLKMVVLIGGLASCLMAFAAGPRFSSPSVAVVDEGGNVILHQRADKVRPIASISKLVVGSVMINRLPKAGSIALENLDTITIDGSERDLMFGLRPKHDFKVRRGSTYTPTELLNISIISSNNIATAALALQLGLDDLINETNFHVRNLGLWSITIMEPTGLSSANVASARDLAKFGMSVANTDLGRISVTPQYSVGKVTYNSTNVFTRLDSWNVVAQKTGYTKAAGRCMLIVIEVQQKLYSIVLLGAPNQPAVWRDVVNIRKYIGDRGFQEPRVRRK